MQIINRELGRSHPLHDVARAAAASPYHLAHVFRACVGLPMHRYLMQVRLAAAAEVLSRDDAHPKTLSMLALRLGFATHSHFTAAFRRAFGVTPTAFRQLIRAERPPAADEGPVARAPIPVLGRGQEPGRHGERPATGERPTVGGALERMLVDSAPYSRARIVSE
jgi:AraC-like DNA-binding protein